MGKETVEPVTLSKFKELVRALPLKERVYIEQWLDCQREMLAEFYQEELHEPVNKRDLNKARDELDTCIRCLRIVRYSY